MKKTKFMRAALLLLVLTLITSCFVGGTFAKYTTSANGTDTARVAKWGFKADENSIVLTDLFKNVYKTGDAENVKSNVDVIAPGTEGSVEFGFAYDTTSNGAVAPEVAYTFGVKAEMAGNYAALDSNPNFKWTLKAGNAESATEYNTVAALLKAINKLSGATDDSGTKTYQPGELPAAFGTADANAKCTVGWKWAFETATGDGQPAAQDKTDTDMGNATDLANVTLKITITATQID